MGPMAVRFASLALDVLGRYSPAEAAEMRFGAIPAAPAPLRCHARLVKLVSSVSGRLVMVDGLDQIEALESCVHHTLRDLEPGQHIPRTVDLGSSGGLIHLLHADAGVVAADYGVIRAIQPKLFRIEDG